MGIKNMLKFLNVNYPDTIKKINNTDFNKKFIAIDASIILYQVVIAIRNSGADMINSKGEITSHILGLFNKTINLLKMNIIPIYVFDGKPPEFKSKVLNNRRDIKQKAYEKLSEDITEDEKIKYFKRTVSISKKQINECIELLDLMGIPYIEAPEEADSQCAELVKSGIADGVLTEDMDIMTFGATKIYRNLTSYKKDNMMICMDDVLKSLNLNYEQFIELCILFGCDYNEKIRDLKPEEIFSYYSQYKNIPETLNLMKSNNVKLPDMTDYLLIKNYFMNPPVIKIDKMELKKCNRDELELLLVNKYGLIKYKIQNKLIFLENFSK
jgi:flap endonuclease-1